MVVTDVGASHVLVLDAGDALTDLFALHALDVGQHALVGEVPLGQVVGGQRGSVVSRQGDQVVEDTGVSRAIALERADLLVGELSQLGVVVLDAHQLVAVVGGNILAFGNHGIEDLLTEVQGPVEGRAVVVDQLGIGDDFADAVNHGLDLANVRLLGFDPQQVSAVLQAGDAVQYAAVFTSASTELEQVGRNTHRTQQLSFTLDHDVAVAQLGFGDFFAIQEGVVQVAQVARLFGDGDLLGQTGTQGVGTSNDDTVVDTQLEERVANGSDLGEEISVRNGNLAVLVTTLLLVGYLVLDLDAAGTRFDHALGQQVGGFRVAEAGVDVGDDRDDVGLEVVDLRLDLGRLGRVTGFTSGIQCGEQQVQLTAVGLTQEGVQLFDQIGNRSLLMHRLVRQRAELGAQGGNHPAGQDRKSTRLNSSHVRTSYAVVCVKKTTDRRGVRCRGRH